MKFCSKCGQKLEDFQKYCTHCGKKISEIAASGDEIQRILSKPWSQITLEDRKILCTPDLGVSFGSVKHSSKSGVIIQNQPPLQDIEVTKTWVIPPQGCPIADHKYLDGQMVLADDTFEIPDGEFAGCRADGPSLFGLPELDDNCTCFLVAGVFEKGSTLARAESNQKITFRNIAAGSEKISDDILDELRSADEIPEVKTIPEINFAKECDPNDKSITENFGLMRRWTKAQKARREIALGKAIKNFDRLCKWIPKYMEAADTAGFHQREKIFQVLKRETNFVLNQFQNLGRFNYYELSMLQTLQNLNKYYDDSLFGENPHHSQDVKRIIEATKRKG